MREREEALQRVRTRIREVRSLENGYALRFAADDETLREIARMIEIERICTPSVRMTLTIAPDRGPVWLEVSGPDEIDSLLEALGPDGPGT